MDITGLNADQLNDLLESGKATDDDAYEFIRVSNPKLVSIQWSCFRVINGTREHWLGGEAELKNKNFLVLVSSDIF